MTKWDVWLLQYLADLYNGKMAGNYKKVYNFASKYFLKWHPELNGEFPEEI